MHRSSPTGIVVATSGAAGAPQHWVTTWAATQQLTEAADLPPEPFVQDDLVLVDSTLRQSIRTSVGGKRIRLRFSNTFGTVPLPIAAVAVALPCGGWAGVSAIEPGTSRPVTFDGRSSVAIPAGAQLVSDPLSFDVAARTVLAVTIHLAHGQLAGCVTSHPGSRTTTYVVSGDHVDDPDLAGAAEIEHWYFLSGVEVPARPAVAAAVLLGDSLTDGRGSTTNLNDRWPDRLLDRLQSCPETAHIVIVNQGLGGNRVLNDGLGPNALARLDRDVLALSRVNRLVVFEGINDIGTAPATRAGQDAVVADLIGAYGQIVTRAHAHGIRVFGGTLTPFGGNSGYDDPGGLREGGRQAVNAWIRTGGRFDAVIDFDLAARDPTDHRLLLPAYDTGDHLHLNPAGYQALADAVPAELFLD